MKQGGQLTKPYAVEGLGDLAIAKQYKIELKNHFQLLQNEGGIENQWTRFKTVVMKSVEEAIGRRRGK